MGKRIDVTRCCHPHPQLPPLDAQKTRDKRAKIHQARRGSWVPLGGVKRVSCFDQPVGKKMAVTFSNHLPHLFKPTISLFPLPRRRAQEHTTLNTDPGHPRRKGDDIHNQKRRKKKKEEKKRRKKKARRLPQQHCGARTRASERVRSFEWRLGVVRRRLLPPSQTPEGEAANLQYNGCGLD